MPPIRMQMPLAKPQPWVMPVTVVCLALGLLVGLMVKNSTPTAPETTGLRPDEQVRVLRAENEKMQAEISKLRDKLDGVIISSTNADKLKKEMTKELNELHLRNGQTAVEGPGITIKLDDSQLLKANHPPDLDPNALLIHDVDLLQLVNELRSAGAEAIAVNDQRVVSSTAIRCVGPVIQVNNHAVGAPFTITAIGKQDPLAGAVNLPMGILDQLRPVGVKIEVAKSNKLRVPALLVLPPIEVGHVVKDNVDTNGQ